MNIYVGNVNYQATEETLRNLFEQYGEVTSVKIITDKVSGRSKGFAFVEMANDDEAREAIENLNGKEFSSRELTVNEARPRESNGGGSRGKFGGNKYNRS
ncbi:MAG: RNA-binding protein [Bacteroidales bacterium]|nr:RNA-binding protein [Bacteroidales bacterium]MBN2761562.1 RNA-binding protein [Bacteroidales bacterium]